MSWPMGFPFQRVRQGTQAWHKGHCGKQDAAQLSSVCFLLGVVRAAFADVWNDEHARAS